MLERIEIDHYRSLSALRMEDLGRINLIAGKNNSGKTTLLEALFFATAMHSPGITLNANITRMERPDSLPLNPQMVRAHWRALFKDLADDHPILISLHDSSFGAFSATISRQDMAQETISFDAAPADARSNQRDEYVLVLQTNSPDQTSATRFVRLNASGVSIEGDDPHEFPVASAIVLPRQISTRDDVDRLSQLRAEKRHRVVVEAIQAIDNRIKDIETSTAAGEPTIWANGHLPQLVPLALYGGGIARIARIILPMCSVENGIVLIDEIETGIHYSSLRKMWQVIDRASEEFNVQVFATTHNYECIEAASEALSSDSLRYHRIDQKEGGSACVTYPPEDFPSAFKHNLEVR